MIVNPFLYRRPSFESNGLVKAVIDNDDSLDTLFVPAPESSSKSGGFCTNSANELSIKVPPWQFTPLHVFEFEQPFDRSFGLQAPAAVFD